MLYSNLISEYLNLSRIWLWCLQLDFWSPENVEMVTIDIDVDIHVPARYLDIVYTRLQQSDLEHE